MKKKLLIISAFIATIAIAAGLTFGVQTIDSNPIKGALADVVIKRTCPTCNGTGKVYIKKRCYSCPGGYEEVPVTCSTCNGTGKIEERKSH